ncbi:ThuA domain-containing protein [Duganella sp. FT92W]|uniref:ThuA domain-containing protein n=1 Tax=Pseudoduganella rivuli TaxID=2666085 RepID=A0A7X2IPJ3_9BURK|nr:ThuA domain-containing protein [Pseudoduganella rivuli]MRV73746.1 ThuA domain-containing protein [Pseudoduganella rivuli]
MLIQRRNNPVATLRRAAVATCAALAVLATPAAWAGQFNVLVFSKTAGWHHDAIPAGVEAIRNLGKLHDFDVFWTEDANRAMNDTELPKYQAVVFLLTTGDILDERQQAAFERYIQSGGGFVGVHSAADTEAGWPWYTRMVGHMFYIHPAVQTAVLKVEDRNFPGMERLAPRSLVTDEWYEFGPALSGQLHYLLTVDESTYQPEARWPPKHGKGMGAFHPVSWYQHYDHGRAFYTARGHLPATYADEAFLHHLYGGIYWAATGRTFKAE